ncbi:MAG: Ig domain-containing protein [Bryobacteraceae bacterium]
MKSLLLASLLAIVPSIALAQTITSTSPLTPGNENQPYSFTLTCTNCFIPTWGIAAGALPTGLTISSTEGTISGTPTVAGTFNFTVSVQNQSGPPPPITKAFSLTIIAPLTNTTPSFANGTPGVVYPTHALTATGGVPPYNWAITSGELPVGMGISGSTIAGTPTTAGDYSFTLTVTDSSETSAASSNTYTLFIVAPTVITTTSLPNGNVNVVYSAQLTCTNCANPLWYVPTGFPPGLTVNETTGAISGTPTTAGLYTFTVYLGEEENSPPPPVTKSLSINIIAPLTVTTASLPNGTLNVAYTSPVLTNSGGVAPFTWSIASGTLPPGLGLTVVSGGTVISGVPTSTGTYPFTIRVLDSQKSIATAPLSITIASGATITVTSLPNGDVKQPYSASLTCSACTGDVWSISSGTLPPPLTLSGGIISGAPTTAGTYSFTVALAPSGSTYYVTPLTQPLSITINPALLITGITIPVGNVGQPYSTSLSATGGSPPYTWSLTGTSNDGLTINAASGVISGTPTTGGQFAFGVMVTDSYGATATKLYTLSVATTLSITTTALPKGTVGTLYPQQTLAASGGQAPFRWSVSVGTLPPGIILNSTFGTLSGTPTTVGTYPFTLLVTDTLSNTATAPLSITVAAAVTSTITITPTTLPGGTVGVAYSQALTAAGGVTPYTWTLVTAAATMPAGLTLNNNLISGTPTTAGTYAFTVQATDSTGATLQARYSIVIAGASTPPLTISTTSLPSGVVGVAYTQTLAATGGQSPYSWTNTGSLPAGLTLNASTGVISGTPTAAGASSFTVTVTDSAKNTAQASLGITVVAPLTVTPTTLPSATAGTAYTQTFTASGGTKPYVFALSGSLPSGFSFAAATGTISGTASEAESGSFTINVSDASGQKVSLPLTLTVNAAPPPAPPTVTLTGVPTNSGFEQQLAPTLSSSGTYPVDINGTITLTFTPSVTPPPGSTGTIDDLMIQFSNGSRTIDFTIPAGSTTPTLTNASSITVLTGTTAGTITLTTTLSTASGPLGTPTTQTIVNNAGVPFIKSVTLTQVPGGVTVTVVGFSSTRDMTNGQFAFVPGTNDGFSSPGTNGVQDVSVALNTTFATWYADTAQSNPYGTQFTLTVPFTQTLASGASVSALVVVSVTVTLANSKGASNPVTLSQ